MAKIDYNSWKQYQSKSFSNENSVGFFSIKDGESALVRFMEDDVDNFEIVALHAIKDGAKFKKISCLRSPYEPVDNCPLCESGNAVNQRIFVKLIRYTKSGDEYTGECCVWERPASFANKLKSLIDEYGDLTDNLFKVVRNGNGKDTTYDVLYAPSNKYNIPTAVNIEPLDKFHALGRIVKELDYAAVHELAYGKAEQEQVASTKEAIKQNESYLEEIRPRTYEKAEIRTYETTTKQPIEQEKVQPIAQASQPVQRQRKPWEVPQDEQEEQPSRPVRNPRYFQ